jgi:predicted glutamine amidotransferase
MKQLILHFNKNFLTYNIGEKFMCLAIYKPENQDIPFNEIIEAWCSNSDGAGLCFINDKNEVVIHKGFMTLEFYLDFLYTNEVMLKSKKVLIHLRYSTSGKTNTAMTHPFPISSKNSDLSKQFLITDKALVHNGVLFSPQYQKIFSDTAIFTKWYKMTRPDDKRLNEVLKGNRIAIMDNEGVKMLGDWTKIDGLYYSNTHYIKSHCSSESIFEEKDFYSYHWKMEKCSHCSSEDIEAIGIYTETFECLDCGNVFNTSNQNFNEVDFNEDNEQDLFYKLTHGGI